MAEPSNFFSMTIGKLRAHSNELVLMTLFACHVYIACFLDLSPL